MGFAPKRADELMPTTNDKQPDAERWWRLWRLAILLRLGLLLIDSVAALGGHEALAVAAFGLDDSRVACSARIRPGSTG
jgi:hypothetical protein